MAWNCKALGGARILRIEQTESGNLTAQSWPSFAQERPMLEEYVVWRSLASNSTVQLEQKWWLKQSA